MFGPSMTAAYATRALVCLVRRGEWVRGSEVISSCSGVPRPYLVKILHTLAGDGLVETKRGKHGGYRLARRPEEVTLYDVFASVDGPDAFDRCLLGLGRCSPERRCPMHRVWSKQRLRIKDRFRELTLRDLAALEDLDIDRDYRFGLFGE